jgi:hypothetical protein
MGLLIKFNDKKNSYYSLNDIPKQHFDGDMIHFFSSVMPLGLIGNYISNAFISNFTPNICFKFNCLWGVIDSYYILRIFECINERRVVIVEKKDSLTKVTKVEKLKVIPLKVLINKQNGRQYFAAYDCDKKAFIHVRFDKIIQIYDIIGEYCSQEKFTELRDLLNLRLSNTWNINFNVGNDLKSVVMDVYVGEDEWFILRRLEREGHNGVVKQLDKTTYRYSIMLYEPGEIVPWIKQFFGRIISFKCDDKEVQERIYKSVLEYDTGY